MTFQDVNNGFYNAMVESLGLSRQHFAMFQPASPVLTTSALWNRYLNLIPPKAIRVDPVLSTGSQYFDRYKALWASLETPSGSQWESEVPESVRNEFEEFVFSRPTPTSPNQLPALFRNWAFLRHPRFANSGATALATFQLDPIANGALRLMPYLGDPLADPPRPDRQPDWDENIDSLRAQLAVAPSRSFSYQQSNSSSNVSNTWAQGATSVFFGVYRSDSHTSHISTVFSENEIELSGSFGHVFTFSPVPGEWFSSAGTKIAFDSEGASPPWKDDTDDPPPLTDWTSMFDPNEGGLARFTSSLIIADSMNITFRSLANFTVDAQTEIRQNKGGGLWPFYSKDSESGIDTEFSFSDGGEMTVTVMSQPGIPIVLGANVFTVQDYLS
jgi:hypothetical protein